jgi:nicotinate dehydrogenase subunit A
MSEAITLTVNGVQHVVHAEPDTALLYVLRNDLKLKGAKFGCGLGLCGSCAILIDGYSVMACDTPLWSAAGKSVITIEGLGSSAVPHALQQAFITEQAAQCGYCISGIIMSAAALLVRNPQPSASEIKQALSRHLCRCGTHSRIIKAIQRAAKEQRHELPSRGLAQRGAGFPLAGCDRGADQGRVTSDPCASAGSDPLGVPPPPYDAPSGDATQLLAPAADRTISK